MANCVNCQRKKANRPRGLCWTCYHTPGMLDRVPMLACVYTRRGIPDRAGGHEIALQPTLARPGTPEKLQVLCERAAAGLALWHPLDRE